MLLQKVWFPLQALITWAIPALTPIPGHLKSLPCPRRLLHMHDVYKLGMLIHTQLKNIL